MTCTKCIELEKSLNEELRLNGMGQERELKLMTEIKELRFKHERLLFRLNQINTNGHPTVGAWHDLMWEVKRLVVKE